MSPESISPDIFRGITLVDVINRDAQSDAPSLRLGKKSIGKLEDLELQAGEDGLFVRIASQIQSGQSLRSIGRALDLDLKILRPLLVAAGIPYPSQKEAVRKLWEDPEFRARNAQAQEASTNRGGWNNPDYRQRILPKKREVMQRLQADPEFIRRNREAVSKATKARWQDPETKRTQADKMRAKWENPEYRAAHREMMLARWADPDYRERHAQMNRDRTYDSETLDGFRERGSTILKALWEDPEFRARQIDRSRAHMNTMRQNPKFIEAGIEASRLRLRNLWQNPEYRARMREKLVLSTIYGYRSDIDFNANSTWEANIARVLTHIGRDFVTRQDLEIVTTQEQSHLFSASKTTFTVDFVTLDNRGNFVIYEIMAHPFKDPIGWTKFMLAKEQYPQFRFVAITKEMYERIRARFEDRINNDPQFHGWENKNDNLKTNPLKYS